MTRPESAPRHIRSIATVSLSGTMSEKLEAATAAGFDAVEINENDLLTFYGSPGDVRLMAQDRGLAIASFQPFRDFEAMDDAWRARTLDRAEQKLDVMQALGTDLLIVCSNTQSAAVNDDARAAADLSELAQRAAARGLRVGYKALSWGRHVNRWRRAWSIVQRADHPALGLVVDSFHTLAVSDDPSGIGQLPADRLFFVHLADAPILKMDLPSWSRHFRNFPGQGQLPVVEFLRSVLTCGYRGPLSVEVFNEEFHAAPAGPTALDGYRSLIFVESEAKAITAQNVTPVPSAGLLPPASDYDGFEFLEFAVDEPSGRKLASWLTAFGFRHAGHHRSKAVDLYRQGGINLVLNREPDSAASVFFRTHGPAVCAMAFDVDDAARAVARARQLDAVELKERVHEGERHIPALRAPDGMLIYLVQSGAGTHPIYEDDFTLLPQQEPVGKNRSQPSGLTVIDHVALALPYSRLDSFVLFYRAVFGFTAEQSWELPDPYGVIRSRTMVSPRRNIRLSLNAGGSRSTTIGRIVAAQCGAGVHHVAFATDDIVATVARLVTQGAHMLPMPANYYDDLATRYDLDDNFLGELRQLNLLYDRDDAGDFVHGFSDSFDGRFSFEIVQRRGYQQYGAANAAMCLAAQAQVHADELFLLGASEL